MTKIFCDACGKRLDLEVERTAMSISCSGGQTELDLCTVCATRIVNKIKCFIVEIRKKEKGTNESVRH